MAYFWLNFSIFIIFINGFLNKAIAYISFGLFSINEAFIVLSSIVAWGSNSKIKKIYIIPLLFLCIIFLKLPFYEGGLIDAIRNAAVFLYIIAFSNVVMLCRKLDKQAIAMKLHVCLILSAVVVSIYYFFYPLRILIGIVTEIPGTGVGLLGNYASLYATSVSVIFYGIFKGKGWVKAVCLLGILAVIIFAQSRASMLCVCFCIFMMSGRILLSKDTAKLLLIILITFFLLMFFGDKIASMEGQRLSISAENIYALFTSIFSVTESSALEGTKGDRLMWWKESLIVVFSSPIVLLLGDNLATVIVHKDTGFGGLVRFPHNSFVTMLRIFGVPATFLFILFALRIVAKVIQVKGKIESPIITGIRFWYPTYVGSYFIASMFSTVIESPFHSMHFWVVSGLVFLLTFNPHTEKRTIKA